MRTSEPPPAATSGFSVPTRMSAGVPGGSEIFAVPSHQIDEGGVVHGVVGLFELDAAARAYRVYYARVELEKSDYTVDHSAFIYLMGRHGEYLGFFPPGTPADILVGTLKPLVAGR